MPQFNAEHGPPAPRSRVSVLKKDGWARYQRICDFETFVIGYFEAFEWLLPTDDSSAGDFIDRGQVLGWGAETYAAFRSVVSTAKANGAAVLDTVRFVLAAKLPVHPIVRVG